MNKITGNSRCAETLQRMSLPDRDIPADASALHPLVSTYRRLEQTSRDLAPGSPAPGSGPGSGSGSGSSAQPAPRLACYHRRGNLRPGRSSAECSNTDDPVSSPRLQVPQLGPSTEERAPPPPLLEASLAWPSARHAGCAAADGGPDCTSLHFSSPQRHHGGCHSGTAADKVLSDKRLKFPSALSKHRVVFACALRCVHMQAHAGDGA